MALIEFKDYPNTSTPLNAENLNNNFNEVKHQDIVTGGEAVKCGYKIDGKDVYVKRMFLGKGGTGGQTRYFNLNNFGIYRANHNLIDYICVATNSNGEQMVLPNVIGSEYSIYCWFNGYIDVFHLKTGANADTSNHDIYLTVYYTNK